jgi:hypothetical protein
MKSLKSVLVLLCSFSLLGLFLAVAPGCGSVSSVARNDLLVRVAVSQAVVRYVDAGESPAADIQRREDLILALGVARQFVQSDEPFDAATWVDGFIDLMDWGSLSLADQILITQVLELVKQEIDARFVGAEARIYLGYVIDTAINAAGSL